MAWGENFMVVVVAIGVGGYYLYQNDKKETQKHEQKRAAEYDLQLKNYNRIKSACASGVAQNVSNRARGQFQLVVEGGELPGLAGYGPSEQQLESPYFEYKVYIGPYVANPPVSRYSFFPFVARCHQANGSLAIEIDRNQQYLSILEQ